MNKFVEYRLHTDIVKFFTAVKKMNLLTFKNLLKVVKIPMKQRMIPLQCHRNLFRKMTVIMQKTNGNLREVLSYPLGPLPWYLSAVSRELKKTYKAALLHTIETEAPDLDVIPRNCVGIFGGMTEIQSYKEASLTFGESSDGLLRSMLN